MSYFMFWIVCIVVVFLSVQNTHERTLQKDVWVKENYKRHTVTGRKGVVEAHPFKNVSRHHILRGIESYSHHHVEKRALHHHRSQKQNPSHHHGKTDLAEKYRHHKNRTGTVSTAPPPTQTEIIPTPETTEPTASPNPTENINTTAEAAQGKTTLPKLKPKHKKASPKLKQAEITPTPKHTEPAASANLTENINTMAQPTEATQGKTTAPKLKHKHKNTSPKKKHKGKTTSPKQKHKGKKDKKKKPKEKSKHKEKKPKKSWMKKMKNKMLFRKEQPAEDTQKAWYLMGTQRKPFVADLDLCMLDQCYNKGTCISDPASPSGFRCLCPPGIIGDKCETVIHTCKLEPCQNGATCKPKHNTGKYRYFCICTPQFTGELCEVPLDGRQRIVPNGKTNDFFDPKKERNLRAENLIAVSVTVLVLVIIFIIACFGFQLYKRKEPPPDNPTKVRSPTTPPAPLTDTSNPEYKKEEIYCPVLTQVCRQCCAFFLEEKPLPEKTPHQRLTVVKKASSCGQLTTSNMPEKDHVKPRQASSHPSVNLSSLTAAPSIKEVPSEKESGKVEKKYEISKESKMSVHDESKIEIWADIVEGGSKDGSKDGKGKKEGKEAGKKDADVREKSDWVMKRISAGSGIALRNENVKKTNVPEPQNSGWLIRRISTESGLGYGSGMSRIQPSKDVITGDSKLEKIAENVEGKKAKGSRSETSDSEENDHLIQTVSYQ